LKRKHFIAFIKNKTYPDYFTHFNEFLQTEINLQWNT
jgi:LysR family transcriptional regulator for metE and metH